MNCSTNRIGVPVVSWTTEDRSIVATFSLDFHGPIPKSIYEIDSSTLDIIGAPFQGHTDYIHGLELPLDCAFLVSVSGDYTIKLWAFESRHLLASFDIPGVSSIALAPNARKLVYTVYKPGRRRIYICNIPPDIVAKLCPNQEARVMPPQRVIATYLMKSSIPVQLHRILFLNTLLFGSMEVAGCVAACKGFKGMRLDEIQSFSGTT